MLSDDVGPVMLGNFMGDFVKGKQLLSYPPEIQRGIRLHRAIDYFTDQHPIVRSSMARLRPTYRHYAGVIVDMFYDHFLAVHWTTYGHGTLVEFADRAYQLLESSQALLPERARFMLPYMIRHNWLVRYQEVEGIRRSLTGLAHRTGYKSGMEHAHEALLANYTDYQAEFEEFFPQIQAHCHDFLEKNNSE